jgi:hypothetical protein
MSEDLQEKEAHSMKETLDILLYSTLGFLFCGYFLFFNRARQLGRFRAYMWAGLFVSIMGFVIFIGRLFGLR